MTVRRTFSIAAVALIVGLVVGYVYKQGDANKLAQQVSTLQTQVSDLTQKAAAATTAEAALAEKSKLAEDLQAKVAELEAALKNAAATPPAHSAGSISAGCVSTGCVSAGTMKVVGERCRTPKCGPPVTPSRHVTNRHKRDGTLLSRHVTPHRPAPLRVGCVTGATSASRSSLPDKPDATGCPVRDRTRQRDAD